MRLSIFFTVAALTLTASFCALAPAQRASAQSMSVVHCGAFTSTTWHEPGGTKSGNSYRLVTINDKTPCTDAISWAKKLMAPGSTAGSITPFEVKGPSGFKCYITPDGSGHAIGGSCRKYDGNGKLIGSWDWLPGT